MPFPISKLRQDADLGLSSFLLPVNFPQMQRTRNLYFAVVEDLSGLLASNDMNLPETVEMNSNRTGFYN